MYDIGRAKAYPQQPIRETPDYPPTLEWLNTLWYIHTKGVYTKNKTNEHQLRVVT